MLRRLASVRIVIGLPAVVTLALALLAGGLQAVSQVVLDHDPQWQGIIAVVLIFIAGQGINPLHGPAFVTALHLPPWAVTLITALIATVGGALQTIVMPDGVHIALVDLLTILAALGFGSPPRVTGTAAIAR